MAVPSFVGLSMTVVVEGQPVTLNSMTDSDHGPVVGSSLDLPLSLAAGLEDGSVLTLYAMGPRAFVDLAADLRHVLTAADDGLVLDAHLSPPRRSGLTGVEELTMINRAIGVLVSRDQTLDEARQQLEAKARQWKVRIFQVAAHLISSAE